MKVDRISRLILHHVDSFSTELQKLGPAARGMLYIQLASSPNHYLVLVITDTDFRFALISTKTLGDSMYTNLVMEDIAWLDVNRIHGEVRTTDSLDAVMSQTQHANSGGPPGSPSRYVVA